VSSVAANNTARNAIFASIKVKMAADTKLTVMAAANAAIADYVKTNTTFKKDQMPLEYKSDDVTKYLASYAAKFDNKATNNIMDIAVKNITTGIFGGAANYWEVAAGSAAGTAETQSVKFTTYKTLFDNVSITLTNIVDDSTAASAPKIKASEAIGRASMDLYFSGKKIDDIVFIAASTTDKTAYGIDAKTIEAYDLTQEDIKTVIDIAKSYDGQISGYLKDEVYLAFSYLSKAEVDKLPAKTKSGQLAIQEFNAHRSTYVTVAKPTAKVADIGFTDT
jgi:hypothetical protein